jgi:hypothetical protein
MTRQGGRHNTVRLGCLFAVTIAMASVGLWSPRSVMASCGHLCSEEQLATGLVSPPSWAAGRHIHFEPASPIASAYPEGAEAEGEGPLLYHEGSDGVQHTPKVYLIFWGSNFATTERGKEVRSMLLKLYEGLTGSAYQGILTQYFDSTGRVSSTVSLASYVDESVSAPKAVSYVPVEEEVTRAINAKGWKAETTAQFMVVTAPGSTYESGFPEGACAYHGVTLAGAHVTGGVVYDFVPYQGDVPFSEGCVSIGNPSKNPVYKTSKSASHEYSEAATNPIPSCRGTSPWNASSCKEIADLCQSLNDLELPSGAYAQDLYDDHQNECSHSDLEPPHVYALTETGTVKNTEVTLHGVVNPESLETKYHFEYGPTTSYGTNVPVPDAGVAASASNVSVSQVVSGLQPETTYHFRIVATNSTGTTDGEDHTFTTGERPWSLQSTANPSGLATNRLTAVSCSSSSACMGVGWEVNSAGSYVPLVERWSGTEWSLQSGVVPTGASLSTLEGVACSSSTVCTGVGHYVNSSGTTVTLAERWNGTEWTVQTTPNPSGAKSSDLWAVSCPSATACVATGEYVNSSGTTVSLAEAWNGTEWSVQATPNPSGATASTLQSVSCSASTSCMAVGFDLNSGTWESFSERWNGTEWSLQSMPKPSGASTAIATGGSCTSATACTAAGYYYSSSTGAYLPFAERWNGSEWSVQSVPNPSGAKNSYLRWVSCATSTSCAATGEYVNSSGTTVTLAERWNGTEWTIQSTANPSGAKESGLKWVSCSSATACTTVGSYVNNQGITTNLAEQGNGTSWSLQSTANPSGLATNRLTAVSCSSSSACMGVGWEVNSAGSYVPLVERWSGTEWSLQSGVVPTGASLSTLEGVACSSSTVCTGVGHYVNSSGTTVTLAERWNGTEWTVQTTPNPSGAKSSDLWAVSCPSATACVATGEYVNSSGTTVSLAEAWNGTEWSVQATPNPSGATASTLQSVSCSASTSCMAVGFDLNSGTWESFSERWNGTEWSLQSMPKPSGASTAIATGGSCTSATACTAAGYYYSSSTGAYLPFAERWNGSEWSVQSVPNPSGAKNSYLRWVSCATSTSCAATGEYVNSSGTTVTLAERWNGTEWTIQSTANPSGAKESGLKWVSCSSATACTTVGSYVNNQGITTNLAEQG